MLKLRCCGLGGSHVGHVSTTIYATDDDGAVVAQGSSFYVFAIDMNAGLAFHECHLRKIDDGASLVSDIYHFFAIDTHGLYTGTTAIYIL